MTDDLDALAEELGPLCEGCHLPMVVVEPEQRTHPCCDPEHGWTVA